MNVGYFHEDASSSLLQALNESIEYGQQLVANNPGWIFISPFDDPLIW